jgi:hypothetical protein
MTFVSFKGADAAPRHGVLSMTLWSKIFVNDGKKAIDKLKQMFYDYSSAAAIRRSVCQDAVSILMLRRLVPGARYDSHPRLHSQDVTEPRRRER